MDDLLRKFGAPLLQEADVLLPVPQVVREHHGDFIDYGIVSAAFGTGEDAFEYDVPLHFEFQQLKRIVLVDGACEYVKEPPLHGPARLTSRRKTLVSSQKR